MHVSDNQSWRALVGGSVAFLSGLTGYAVHLVGSSGASPASSDSVHVTPVSCLILAAIGIATLLVIMPRERRWILLGRLMAATAGILAVLEIVQGTPSYPVAHLGAMLVALALVARKPASPTSLTVSNALSVMGLVWLLSTILADQMQPASSAAFSAPPALMSIGLIASCLALSSTGPFKQFVTILKLPERISFAMKGLVIGLFAALPAGWCVFLVLHPSGPPASAMVVSCLAILSCTAIGLLVMKVAEAFASYQQSTKQRQVEHENAQRGLTYQLSSLQREIAQRKRELETAESSLKTAAEANSRLSIIARHTHNGVILTDGVGQIVWFNPAWEDLSGSFHADWTGKSLEELIVSDSEVSAQEKVKNQIRSGLAGDFELKFRTDDGQVRWLSTTFRPVHNLAGSLTNFIVILTDVTEYRGAEQRIKAANDRLQFALRSSGYGIWEMHLSPERLEWDERMLESHGLKREHFDGKSETWRRLVHPEDIAAVAKHRDQVVSGELARYDIDFRIIRPDGAVRYIEAHGFLVTDPEGRPQRLVGLNRDITADQEIRETLRVAEERLELALRATNEGVWDWNIATGHVYRDRRWAEMIGSKEQQLKSDRQDWLERVYPDDLPSARAALEAHLQGRAPLYIHEHRLRTDSGRWIWTLDRGKIVSRDKDGNPSRMVGTQSDITERKLLEERLRNSEEISIHVSRLAQIGAWEWTLTHEFMTWSPELFRLAGVELGFNPTLESMALMFPMPDRELFTSAIEQATKDGRPFDVEVSMVTAKGKNRWVRVIGQADLKEGRAARIFGAVQDITARREAEEAQRALESQLFQVQKMETLGTLAGGIAHDFNNLLTGIMGYQDLALDTLDETNPARQCLSEARNASFRARELVDQILTFSRQSGAGERLPLDLSQVIEEARRFLRATVPSIIQIEVQIARDCGRVLADATQIHQLILNLGTNAAHAMRAAGGTLSIELVPVTVTSIRPTLSGNLMPGAYLKMSVSDTGHGIDPETLKRVFDPFFTTKSVGEGTGLGLAVVHGVARAHGGAIEVTSTIGKGSRFDVFLPAVTAQADEIEPAVVPAPMGHGEMICVVDDEDFVAQVTKASLNRLGYRAVVFNDPLLCLEALRRDPTGCSLLVSDQTMPGMNGMKLAASIREFAPTLPVLVMSGYFSQISPTALEEIGRIALLAKPFTTDELSRAVHGLLHPGQGGN